jgi:aspartate carbamoyltransferase catalytic subunit
VVSLEIFKHRLLSAVGGRKRLPAPTYSGFKHHDLLGIEQLDSHDIQMLLDLGENYLAINQRTDKKHAILKGRTLINLFFENSTRTRTSFEIAGKRLGMDVINISTSVSSTSKGESLLDTVQTLGAMSSDVIVMRHPDSGSLDLLKPYVKAHLVNGGDGSHEHPTQALLDALTIRQAKGRLEGLNVAICGDILHSRVARSNIILLKKMGAKVRLIAPSTLMPAAPKSFGVELFNDMDSGLKNVDVIMMLRVQNERMSGRFIPSVREYAERFGLNSDRLALAHPDAIVLHPGPINRGVEIMGDVADNLEHSLILNQVETGVAMRQAVLQLLLG